MSLCVFEFVAQRFPPECDVPRFKRDDGELSSCLFHCRLDLGRQNMIGRGYVRSVRVVRVGEDEDEDDDDSDQRGRPFCRDEGTQSTLSSVFSRGISIVFQIKPFGLEVL